MKTFNTKTGIRASAFGAFVFVSLAARAGVTIIQNESPGATSWPGSPIISTMTNPAGGIFDLGFDAVSTPSLAETFTITTTNYILQTIDIFAGEGSGTGLGTNLVLNLYDLGSQTAPNPPVYTINILGSGLLGSGAGLAVSYSNQVDGILEFDFSGADQVLLQQGHMYAFELLGVSGTSPIYWWVDYDDTFQNTNYPYAGGAAYQDQAWIFGFNAADYAMAVYAIVSTNPPPPPPPPQCLVDWNDVHQRIDGFGASSAFLTAALSTAEANMFFSTNGTGIGLSLVRSQIQPAESIGGNAYSTPAEITIMQQAQARGARVWCTPWTPPDFCKSPAVPDGGNYTGGGGNSTDLLYASELANYVLTMRNTYGVNLYAISIQNEPDESTTYASCLWTAPQFHDFVPCLQAALAADGVSDTEIMLPEDSGWDFSLAENTMDDTNTAAMVGILAGHGYSGVPGPVASYGKTLWETEVSTFDTYNRTISNGIYWAGIIHTYLTAAQVNAWHYWWLVPLNTDNEGLTDIGGTPAKRMYVLGQYSRFVRPNYYRIGVTINNAALISAYKDSVSPGFAIVAVNPTSAAINETFNLANFNATAVTPWITSATLSLSSQPPATVTNASFTYTLPAMSVVTFVGQAALPVLGATPQGGNFVLSWPTNYATGYSLQFSANLNPTNWNSVSFTPVIVNGQNVVTDAMNSVGGFYRLIKP